jgi:DNA polymerase V
MDTLELIKEKIFKEEVKKHKRNGKLIIQKEIVNLSNSPFHINSEYKAKVETKNDFIEAKIDLNELLIRNSANTFLIRVRGDSMINAGINTDDILLVDCSGKHTEGKIIIAAINNELLVKKLHFTNDGIELHSENDKYKPIKIKDTDKFNIWGVVTSVIKTMI